MVHRFGRNLFPELDFRLRSGLDFAVDEGGEGGS